MPVSFSLNRIERRELWYNLLTFVSFQMLFLLKKDNGTKVHYFLYPEFEIHQNILPANTVQDWHKHQAIEEIIVPTKGSVTIQVLEEDVIKDYTVHCGDVLRVKKSIHRIIGDKQEDVAFTVFRFVSTGKEQSEIIKNDK